MAGGGRSVFLTVLNASYIRTVSYSNLRDIRKSDPVTGTPYPLPKHVNVPGDLDQNDPSCPLFYGMSLYSAKDCAEMPMDRFQETHAALFCRDRTRTFSLWDSGAYTLIGSPDEAERFRIGGSKTFESFLAGYIEKVAATGDYGIILDIPPSATAFGTFKECLNRTVANCAYIEANAPPEVKWLNVVHAGDMAHKGSATFDQVDEWLNAVERFKFHGWSTAGELRDDPASFLYLVAELLRRGHLAKGACDIFHVLGQGKGAYFVWYSRIGELLCDLAENPDLVITFDSTNALLAAYRRKEVFQQVALTDRNSETLGTILTSNRFDNSDFVGCLGNIGGHSDHLPTGVPGFLALKLMRGELCVRRPEQGHENSRKDHGTWDLLSRAIVYISNVAVQRKMYDMVQDEVRAAVQWDKLMTSDVDKALKAGIVFPRPRINLPYLVALFEVTEQVLNDPSNARRLIDANREVFEAFRDRRDIIYTDWNNGQSTGYEHGPEALLNI